MKILIVEDVDTINSVFKMVLSSHELTIITGLEDGPIDLKALQCFDQQGELVVIDVSDTDLAFLDGNLLTERLGVDLEEPLKERGAVTVSTSANLELVKEFKRLGVDYVIDKSAIVSFVKAHLNEAFALRQTRLAARRGA